MIMQFEINHPGEPAAGINGYSDIIKIEVDSGDPGGEPGEFRDEFKQFLSEWFDGASISEKPEDI